ncbi:DUF5719 family protein [Streptomyces albipurpureus]|uniref:DUF5719 family protein n=1 Tax=Streptomyces albipurpureus TaxID=2897419 RepID=A0ABT0UPP7_9ACTN|nr:DUF5719 family protein [Streptomyces sp. CWNU-1]MCM2390065.1 DUF5719 family protein [Streptomyces sp. CWNU-1]
MKRTTLSLLATVTALAAITGLASLMAPDSENGSQEAGAPARLPVERSTLLCPAPGGTEAAETTYTTYTPVGSRSGAVGTAALKSSVAALAERGAVTKKAAVNKPTEGKPVVSLTEPGRPAAVKSRVGGAPALIGTATGRLAPGWSAQLTSVAAGDARGLLGVSCTAPHADFWFPGASTAKERQDYVHLTNPDDIPAVVDIELYGKGGALRTTVTEGIPVPAGSSIPVLLSTLTAEAAADVTVHVATRSGRVGAAVRVSELPRAASDAGTESSVVGSDWLSATAEPSPSVVLPGIPADATSVRLVAFAPGEDDADLAIQLASPSGKIVPAGNESLHVKSGMTASVELRDVTRGEAGSLLLGPSQSGRAAPVVAALRVVRGKGAMQEIAFIPATAAVGARASIADNRAKGAVLSLTAPGAAARVRVTASAGTQGGAAVVRTYQVRAGTTLAFAPPVPTGLKGSYALTVVTESGGPVFASRTLALPQGGVPSFTIQTLSDDRGTVAVPKVEDDLSVLGE